MNPTPLQYLVLGYLRDHPDANYREIAEYMGFEYESQAHNLTSRIIEAGLLTHSVKRIVKHKWVIK